MNTCISIHPKGDIDASSATEIGKRQLDDSKSCVTFLKQASLLCFDGYHTAPYCLFSATPLGSRLLLVSCFLVTCWRGCIQWAGHQQSRV